jgi:hypothetical protein
MGRKKRSKSSDARQRKRCSVQRASAAMTLSQLGVVIGSGGSRCDRRRKLKLINGLSHVPPSRCEPNEGAGRGRPKVAYCFPAVDYRKAYIWGQVAGYPVYIRSASNFSPTSPALVTVAGG